MSDKHTDAQGERRKYEAYLRRSNPLIFFEVHDGRYFPDSLNDGWAVWQARATEGQAQTGANTPAAFAKRYAELLEENRKLKLAAQLADSTAPGALPVGWRDKLRWSKANTDYHGLIAFTPAQLEHFVSMLAAPTAQQSLTAGGAVPDDDAEEEENGWRRLALQFDGHRMQALGHLRAMLSDSVKHIPIAADFLKAGPLSGEAVLAERIAHLAAAPLPQVQSEALDGLNGPMTDTQKQEARHLYRNLYHLGPEAMEDVVRYASVCGYVNGRKDFADQQPVTPSGALADNDGGVANKGDLKAVHDFLMGESALEGVQFGERHPTKAGAFWWRLNLRAALAKG